MTQRKPCASCGHMLEPGLSECPNCGDMAPLSISLDPGALAGRAGFIVLAIVVGFFVKLLLFFPWMG